MSNFSSLISSSPSSVTCGNGLGGRKWSVFSTALPSLLSVTRLLKTAQNFVLTTPINPSAYHAFPPLHCSKRLEWVLANASPNMCIGDVSSLSWARPRSFIIPAGRLRIASTPRKAMGSHLWHDETGAEHDTRHSLALGPQGMRCAVPSDSRPLSSR